MKVTYLGTTMLLFDDGKDQVLFDCHVTRPSIKTCLLGKLDSDESVVNRVISDFKINRLRGIFISHSHHDHVLDAPSFANKCDAPVYGSISTKNIALGNGVAADKIHSYDDSMEYEIGDFHITIIPSIHSTPHWYNNDLGKVVDQPFAMPASKKKFKEGGSVDFLVTHNEKTYLIRPSYNYIENQFDHIKADVLFLGIGGMSKDTGDRHATFFAETIDKVSPEVVIPVHWDNFFAPLYGGELKGMPKKFENTGMSMHLLAENCSKRGVKCVVQLPLTTMEI